jgi:hypothetical protein
LFIRGYGANEPAIIPVLKDFKLNVSGFDSSRILKYYRNIVGTP